MSIIKIVYLPSNFSWKAIAELQMQYFVTKFLSIQIYLMLSRKIDCVLINARFWIEKILSGKNDSDLTHFYVLRALRYVKNEPDSGVEG